MKHGWWVSLPVLGVCATLVLEGCGEILPPSTPPAEAMSVSTLIDGAASTESDGVPEFRSREA